MSINDYIRETRAEMKHVVWPTRAQTIAYSLAVIIISLVVAAILGGADSIFSVVLKRLLGAE